MKNIACVASVSNRVMARKLERERKKKGNFSRRTRAETLATQAMKNITIRFEQKSFNMGSCIVTKIN